MRLFRRRNAAGGTPYRSDSDWTVSWSWSKKWRVSSRAAFSSNSGVLLLLLLAGASSTDLYGGGGAEAGMDLDPRPGTEVYKGGSRRPCGNGEGVLDTWQNGQ